MQLLIVRVKEIYNINGTKQWLKQDPYGRAKDQDNLERRVGGQNL